MQGSDRRLLAEIIGRDEGKAFGWMEVISVEFM